MLSGWHGCGTGELEAVAILQGIRLIATKGWQSVIVESDSAIVIDHMMGTHFAWRVEPILANVVALANPIR